MIKLHLLLRHPGPEPALDAAVRALIEQQGMTITGVGRATVSAEIAEAAFAHLFGAVAPGADLPLPAPLADVVSLITRPPRHSLTPHTPRARHAAI